MKIRKIEKEEIPYLYSGSEPGWDKAIGCIGHLRFDFGWNGEEFWTTWWPHDESYKTPEFREELDDVINQLRKSELKDLRKAARWCYAQGAELPEAMIESYGIRVDTDAYSYLFRLTPARGNYQYCYCYLRELLDAVIIVKETDESPFAEQHNVASGELLKRKE